MTGYYFHLKAEADLNEIWDYFASDGVDAADRVVADIHQALKARVPMCGSTGKTEGEAKANLEEAILPSLSSADILVQAAGCGW